MSTSSIDWSDCVAPDDVIAAALDHLRSEGDGCLVGISELLEELNFQFGDRFRITSEMHRLLDLMVTLGEHPNVHLVQALGIYFAWSDAARD